MKNIYLAIKFREDYLNHGLVKSISNSVENYGGKVSDLVRNKNSFEPKELMALAFTEIDNSDLVLVEFSEKGVGLGIEAGYAFAKGIPVVVIAKIGSDVSHTVKGIAQSVFYYNFHSEIEDIIKNILV